MKAPSRATFNFIVNPSTGIKSGDQRLTLVDIICGVDKPVSVRFVPTRRGNIAQSIEIAH
jgi:hypothetical protein